MRFPGCGWSGRADNLTPLRRACLDGVTIGRMTAPATLRRVFVGPAGIRAGWRILLFVVLVPGGIGLPPPWVEVRELRLGDRGGMAAARVHPSRNGGRRGLRS